MAFTNFAIVDCNIELPDYAEYYDESDNEIYVSVLDGNVDSFCDWCNQNDLVFYEI